MLRYLSPSGAPLEAGQLLSAVKTALSLNGAGTEPLASMAARLQVRYVFATCSGRSGLWVILKALRRLGPDRDVVALPAYTCFSVPSAIVRAGLRLHPVDIDPETLDFDFAQLSSLPDKNLLCIITTNLFGFVNDASRIREIARVKGAFLVDDAAQALGAYRHGSLAGTLGDVGLYSFGRGKVLTVGEGGLVLTNSLEIAAPIENEIAALPKPSSARTAWLFAQMLSYVFFLNPRLYWIPNSLPFLKLGVTEFAPDFPIARLATLPAALLVELIDRVWEFNEARRRNAATIAGSLEGNPRFTTPTPAPDCRPTYIRFPVIADDAATRTRALRRLRAVGIGASPFYPSAICDIGGIEKFMAVDDFHRPKAEALAQRLFTLPTHPFVRQPDLKRMVEVLNGL